MTDDKPDNKETQTPITENSREQSNQSFETEKKLASKFLTGTAETFIQWFPMGSSGGIFISFLFKQDWFMSLLIFPLMIISVVWARYTKSVLTTLGDLAEDKGDKDAKNFATSLSNLDQAIRWQLAKVDDKYLKLQGNTVKDFTTEGYKPGSNTFVPLLNEVFVPLDLSNAFMRSCEGEFLPMQQGFKWDIKTIELLQKDGLRIWDILKQTNKISAYKRLAVLAWGGYGKTTLLRHITYIYTNKKEKQYQAPKLLPVLLVLRRWQETIATENNLDLPTLIEKHHIPHLPESDGLILPPNWAKNNLRSGKFLVMFDGFDEVKEEWRFKVSQWLGKQMNNYQETIFILTSRPSGYKHFIPEYKLKAELFVKAFNPDQQERFINNWYWCQERYARGGRDTPDVKAEAVNNANNLIQQLKQRTELNDLAKNPLLLNMITNLHRSYPGEELPKRRGELYREVVNLQLGNRPLARQISLILPPNEAQLVLQGLALFMVLENQTAIDYDLLVKQVENPVKSFDHSVDVEKFIKQIVDVSELLVKRDENYEFAHLSFQGYLGAKQIMETKQEDLLIQNWQNSWWRETILLYCAQTNPNIFLKQLINIGTEEAVKLAYDCIKETPRKIDPNIEKELQDLESKVSTFLFKKLEEYLKTGQWQKADEETDEVMIQIGDKEQKGYLSDDDLKNFPCEELRTINDLWVNYSKGKFGFTVQRDIWLDCGGKIGEYEFEPYKKFAEKVRWYNREKDEWWEEMVYVLSDNTPIGHLPREVTMGKSPWDTFKSISIGFSFLAQRLVNCNI